MVVHVCPFPLPVPGVPVTAVEGLVLSIGAEEVDVEGDTDIAFADELIAAGEWGAVLF